MWVLGYLMRRVGASLVGSRTVVPDIESYAPVMRSILALTREHGCIKPRTLEARHDHEITVLNIIAGIWGSVGVEIAAGVL